MDLGRFTSGAVLSSLCLAMFSSSSTAAPFPEFVDPHPAAGNQFGATVVALSTGNIVVTSPFDDFGGTDAGAVYLFNGATGALISTLRGSTTSDNVGSGGVTVLTNGNYVIRTPGWDNGATADAGAVTWASGTTGLSGTVSAANSLVGSTPNDLTSSSVTALSNGNYLIRSQGWDNGAIVDAGAVTWGSGTTGVSGTISAANSLVGSTISDFNSGGVTALSNGNYVVRSQLWDKGAIVDAGAVTWGSGTTGVSGVISAANSLVGSTANDQVGNLGVTALTNGNYVVGSQLWDNGGTANAGAATWGNGTTGLIGAVSAANSLVGSTANDQVGSGGATALTNGNYVVRSSSWNNGATPSAGAITWGSGTTGVSGTVSAANSLVGSTSGDNVGSSGVTALTNGNYVVSSSSWDGISSNVGAVTWGSGTTGVSGAVSAANSLVGSTSGDGVGSVVALSNGNYVVRSASWDNGAIGNAGAVTWGSGASGVVGVVSAANSLVGSQAGDGVGANGVTLLTNGSYVVVSLNWDNGAIGDAGAMTWGSGTTGVSGVVSASNSLVGSTASDFAAGGVTALSNGNYVVNIPLWDNGAIANVGAATCGSGTSGVSGVVTAGNSLVGSKASDQVGFSVTALTNGNYVVASTSWDNGLIVNVGAVTWGSGTTGVSGVVSIGNSLVGSTASDGVGSSGVLALSNGNYVVRSSAWHNGAFSNAGAATWGSGTAGVSGVVSAANSLVGTSSNSNLQSIVEDNVNSTFFGRFLSEGGGRVRVGPIEMAATIVSAIDIPDDQGGWVRLTFSRSPADDPFATPPVATYDVWRHVPGTLPSSVTRPIPSQRLGSSPDVKRVRAELPSDFALRELNRRLYVTVPRSGAPGIAAAFPPGTWELVASVSAVQQPLYVVAVPTISNAAPNDFVVTAHTTTPSIWFTSNTISGQSVDNLAPAQPSGVLAAYSGGQTHLEWSANSEPDLNTYKIYRGTSADFIPSLANLIASPTSPSYADPGPAGRYYKLSAVDVNGNESSFAVVTPEGTTGVEEVPVAFMLERVRPNPTLGNGLNVAFALPTGGRARLELIDVGGRQVLVREVGSLGAGRHTLNLAEGHRVAPGLYWVRLSQGADQQKTRVAVIE